MQLAKVLDICRLTGVALVIAKPDRLPVGQVGPVAQQAA
jgi:hypothetical protein